MVEVQKTSDGYVLMHDRYLAVTKSGVAIWDSSVAKPVFYAFSECLHDGLNIVAISGGRLCSFFLSFEGDNQIYSYVIDPISACVTCGGICSAAGADASVLRMAPFRQFLISLSTKSGLINSFSLMQSRASLPLISQIPSPGKQGPNRVRQTWAHPCSACFDAEGQFLLVCDSGHDAVHLFEADTSGALSYLSSMSVRPGSCPAELVAGDADFFYLHTDGIESIYCFRLNRAARSLQPIQIVQPLPESYTGLDVCCKNLRFLSQSGELLFCLPQLHGYARFQTKDGIIVQKRWFAFEGRLTALDVYSDGIVAACSNRVFSIGENGDLHLLFSLDEEILATCVVNGGIDLG